MSSCAAKRPGTTRRVRIMFLGVVGSVQLPDDNDHQTGDVKFS
jgi:hypothetical protein